jgi:hypothetical protein
MKRVLSICAVLVAVGVLASMAGAEERKGPSLSRVSGEVTKIDGAAIDVTRRGDSGAKTTTITTNADTKVKIPTGETAPGGGEGGNKPVYKDGTVNDLKVGDHVTAMCEGDVAKTITVNPPKPKKEGGEGERKAPAPAPKERKEGEGR